MFGVAKDTNEVTNPTALGSVAPGTGVLFTNVAYNDEHPARCGGRAGRPSRPPTSPAGGTGPGS